MSDIDLSTAIESGAPPSANPFQVEVLDRHGDVVSSLDPDRTVKTVEIESSATEPDRAVVRRRIVTKTDMTHVAQDILMNGIAVVLGSWGDDPVVQERLAAAGISVEAFGPVITRQADRVAKTLRFEQAWKA